MRREWAQLLLVLLPILRPLRVFRSMRALRSLRALAVLGKVGDEIKAGLKRRGLDRVLGLLAVVVVASALLGWAAERREKGPIQDLGDALWWAISTATTVGYGDKYPVTVLGRVLAVLLMLLGVAVFGLVTASVAAEFVKSDEKKAAEATPADKMDEVLARLADIEAKVDDRPARKRSR